MSDSASEKKPKDLLELLEGYLKQKGSLTLSYDAGGGGMGLHVCAHWSAQGWPYCSGGNLEGALKNLIAHELEEEEKRITARLVELEANRKLVLG